MVVLWCVPSGILHQYIAGIAGNRDEAVPLVSTSLTMLTSATCYGWITPMLNYLEGPDSEIPMTKLQSSWVVSVMELGNMLSPLPAGLLCDYIGRKPVLLASGPLYILTWIMILAYPSVLVLGVVRFVQGLVMGMPFTAGTIYLGEVASNNVRGAITSLIFNSWWIGFLIEYAVGPYLSFKNFTYFTLSVNIPFILLFFWQPETPYYHLMSGNEDQAYQSLKYFRDCPPDMVKEELEKIKTSIEANRKPGGIRDLIATPADRKAFYLLMILSAVRIASGNGAILVYATQIFDVVPNLSIPSDTVTITLGAVMLVGGCVSSFTSDTLGRRPLLLMSSFGCLICQLCTGTYFLLLQNGFLKDFSLSWVAPTCILVYSGLCTAGMYPVCAAYTSELFTSKTRSIASSMAAVSVTSFCFIILIIYQPVTSYIGLYANFFIYSGFCIIGSVYFYLQAPETKGKSFAQIREELCETNFRSLSTST